MTRPPMRVGALLAALALFGAACGDDANDRALHAQMLADRLAADSRTVVEPVETAPVETTSPAVEPVEATSPAVERVETAPVVTTGVVVPVIALDNSFRPGSVEAKIGDQVVWENRGRNEHDVLSIEGTLADGTAWGVTVEDFQPGDIYAHVFTEPGEYRYYCTIHGSSEVGMIGTVIVTA